VPKIAFVVEPHFLEHHWGVRVYVYSLAKLLAHHHWTVDFVSPEASSGADLRWHKRRLRDESLFTSAAPSAGGNPSDVWNALRDVAFKTGPKPKPAPSIPAGLRRPEVMPIGSSLAVEDYDVALVTNPWMVKWRERLPARKTIGLVFDLIPNLFGILSDEGKPFAFAHQHEVGFRYYEECCDQILAISETTRSAYLDFVRGRRPGAAGPEVIALPPFAPYHALEEPARACPTTRAARIVLAGCFDLRKGLRELPGLLNGVADVVDEVVMYGGARCPKADAEAFFKALRVERVEWHLGATAGQVQDLFRRSRLLVFPSKFEGLGLPLIEAQLCGCRVATYPISPMRELALTGAIALAEEAAVSLAAVRAALLEPFDHAPLAAQARAAFVHPVLQRDPFERVAGIRPAAGIEAAHLALASSNDVAPALQARRWPNASNASSARPAVAFQENIRARRSP
jgi:glycosyltransferase involved in cell wall biosynthesis